jgi:hypothetical protein
MIQKFVATTAGATLLSSAVFAQQPNQSTASIPDFSGVWTKPYIGIEPPLSGPRPVKSRFPTIAIAVGDYTNPILTPHAAEMVKKQGQIELSGVPIPNPRNQCWPEGVPLVFRDVGVQMFQQADKITILYDYDHEVRRVRMNEPHFAPVTPSWYGDSVGYYEGDTLVIDTVGVKIGPFPMVDVFGTPHTPALHVVERYRLIDYEATIEAQEWGLKENTRLRGAGGDANLAMDPDYNGKGLQLQFTVEDEGVFTMPWSATVTYRRALGLIPENVCAENLRGTQKTAPCRGQTSRIFKRRQIVDGAECLLIPR